MASAYSRTTFSVSENSKEVRKLGKASIFSGDTPLFLLTAEPMSIQKGHSTRVATRNCARSLRPAPTEWLEANDRSI